MSHLDTSWILLTLYMLVVSMCSIDLRSIARHFILECSFMGLILFLE